MAGQAISSRPHVVCVPFPLQGHIIPMLKLAKLLHHKGFHVTFVNTEVNHNRVLDSRGPGALDGLPDFRFETIPLEHPPANSSLALNLLALREICRNNFLSPFSELVTRLNEQASSAAGSNSDSNPPVSCILSDAILTYTLAVSDELGIPNVLLWNMGASGFLSFKHSRDQIKKCLVLLKDPSTTTDSEEWDMPLEWIPGLKGAKLRDLPKFIQTRNPSQFMKDSSEGDLERASRASAVIFHSFDALESKVLHQLSPFFRKIYGIGPLQLMLNQVSNAYYDSVECNLWNEEAECVKWLDAKEPNSVVYINFGSTTMMTVEQLVELAWGLANSNHNFLWVTRPDMIMGEKAVLPPEFLSETEGKGYIASWCPQDEVLNHPSIGGFVTHSGWNSTVESISAGVPLVCWPFFGEHFVNCRKSCGEWGIGMELSSDFKREEVEKLVKEVLAGEKGKLMKSKVVEWKNLAEEAISCGGSSTLNLDSLVNDVLLSKSSS